MTVIFVKFDITRNFNGVTTFKCLDFDFEFSIKEKDNDKLMRLLTKKLVECIRQKQWSLETLKQYITIPLIIKSGIVVIPVRVAELIDEKVEKVTISLPSRLVSTIDNFVATHFEHQTRSSFLADAALNLILEENTDFSFDSEQTPKGRETNEF